MEGRGMFGPWISGAVYQFFRDGESGEKCRHHFSRTCIFWEFPKICQFWINTSLETWWCVDFIHGNSSFQKLKSRISLKHKHKKSKQENISKRLKWKTKNNKRLKWLEFSPWMGSSGQGTCPEFPKIAIWDLFFDLFFSPDSDSYRGSYFQ